MHSGARMEHESDDDVLIIEDETADQIQVELKVEPDTEDLFRQIEKKKSVVLFPYPTARNHSIFV